MDKVCKQCGGGFEIAKEDLDYYAKISVPEPVACPECRMQRRMAFRNERNLYKRKCDFSGKDILSVYPPDSDQRIYDQKIWWSDEWDALDYGKEFDFGRSFFEQFGELMKEVPRINLQNRNNENSDYCNDTNDLKNSYLCFNTEQASDFYYVNTGGYGTNCIDAFWAMQVELCYECSKVMGGYHCFWCFNCTNISDCYICENLIGCKNCFGCTSLRQKEYCVYNKQLSKTDYEEFINNFSFSYSDVEDAKNKFAELKLEVPHRALEITQSENCVGDFISNSKNCVECFDVLNSENCKFIRDGLLNNSYDCFNVGLDAAFLYECVGVYRGNNLRFCDKCTVSNDLTYCDWCFQCSDCFGCGGLRHKKYCILNKQYTKEAYEEKVAEIIEHMKKAGEYGEFFPVQLSPFGYNDSLAMWDFPLKRSEALGKGFKWNDYESPALSLKSVLASELPEKIGDVGDEILSKAIACKMDGKLFKIIPQELEFYRKQNIPLPRLCPDCRHEKRKKQINPRKLMDRKCGKCGVDIKTTYSPDRPEKVYCEECFMKEVY
jgi:hypothetical protein